MDQPIISHAKSSEKYKIKVLVISCSRIKRKEIKK